MSLAAGFLLSVVASGIAMILFQGHVRHQVMVGIALIAAIPAVDWLIAKLPDPCTEQAHWWQPKSDCAKRPQPAPLSQAETVPAKHTDRVPLLPMSEFATATIIPRRPAPAKPELRRLPQPAPRAVPNGTVPPPPIRPFAYSDERPLCEETVFHALGICVEGPNGIWMPNPRKWSDEQTLMDLRSHNHQ